ncbi:MAG: hypothetical protein Q9187_000029 [Circinaria calcarea]
MVEQAHRRYRTIQGDIFGVEAADPSPYQGPMQSRFGSVAKGQSLSVLSSTKSSINPTAPKPAYLSLSKKTATSSAIARLSSPLELNPITADDFPWFQAPRKAPKPNGARIGDTDVRSTAIPASPTFSDTSITGTVTSPSSPRSPKEVCSRFSFDSPPTLHLSRDFRASFRSWSKSTRKIGHSTSSSTATITRSLSSDSRPPSQFVSAINNAEPSPRPLRIYRGERPFFGSSIYDRSVSRFPVKATWTTTSSNADADGVRSSHHTSATSSIYSTNSDLATQLQSPDSSFFEQPPTPSIPISTLIFPVDEPSYYPVMSEAKHNTDAHIDPSPTNTPTGLAPLIASSTRQTSELGELYDSYWQHVLLGPSDEERSKRKAGDWGGFEPVVVVGEVEHDSRASGLAF